MKAAGEKTNRSRKLWVYTPVGALGVYWAGLLWLLGQWQSGVVILMATMMAIAGLVWHERARGASLPAKTGDNYAWLGQLPLVLILLVLAGLLVVLVMVMGPAK
jgi:hypothetical protein